MADDTNWLDPCEAAVVLRKAYYDAQQGGGGQVIGVRFGDREVKYSSDKTGGLERLYNDMLRAEALCDIKLGNAPKRHAIKFGSVRRCIT